MSTEDVLQSMIRDGLVEVIGPGPDPSYKLTALGLKRAAKLLKTNAGKQFMAKVIAADALNKAREI